MFRFKQFTIHQDQAGFKVGTDGILLGAWSPVGTYKHILDIGTGTGLLALMLAQKHPTARIDAIELDEASALQAQQNVAASPFASQITLHQATILDFAPPHEYDLILCNPPFFRVKDGTPSPLKSKRQARHTVSLTYEQLLESVTRLLGENGRFHTIIPLSQQQPFTHIAAQHNLYCSYKTTVQPKPSKPAHRLLLQYERLEKTAVSDHLIIETETHHVYTQAYVDLTQPYYLNLNAEKRY